MAKYEVTHRCNHNETVTLFGPTAWWNRESTEKRIYCDVGAEKTCLYVTGNSRNRPGSLDGNQALRPALEMCNRLWRTLKMSVTAEGRAQ